MAKILEETGAYPYFLQEWGKHCWDCAKASPITLADAETATQTAVAELDASFFHVRYNGLKQAERQYLQAMATLGQDPHQSADVARALDQETRSAASVRRNLIAKGIISSPAHGKVAFTVPQFDRYLRRVVLRAAQQH